MLDQLFGLILLGLGLQNPVNGPAVKGDSDVVHTQSSETRGSDDVSEAESEDEPEQTDRTKSEQDDDADASDQSKQRQLEERQLESKRQHTLDAIRQREQKLKEVFDVRRKKQQETLRHNQEEAHEAAQVARNKFHESLAGLKDARKKAIAESLDTKISELNTKRTTTLLSMLTKIQEILDKISGRAASAQAAGKNTDAVSTALAAAQAAHASALAAVNAQAGKTYVPAEVSQETLGSAVRDQIRLLQADIKTVHDMVISARKATKDAIVALDTVMGHEPEPTLSPSP